MRTTGTLLLALLTGSANGEPAVGVAGLGPGRPALERAVGFKARAAPARADLRGYLEAWLHRYVPLSRHLESDGDALVYEARDEGSLVPYAGVGRTRMMRRMRDGGLTPFIGASYRGERSGVALEFGDGAGVAVVWEYRH